MRNRLYLLTVGLAAIFAFVLVSFRLHFSPDIASLLPNQGDMAALARFARAFSGGEPGLILIEGTDPEEVQQGAFAATQAVRTLPSVKRAYDHLPIARNLLPSEWFLLATPDIFPALQEAITPAGMRRRLSESRALLLAPGGSAFAPWLTRDPLRLGQIVALGRKPDGFTPVRADGSLASEDGHARLVVIEAKGNALKSGDARAFTNDIEQTLVQVRKGYPHLTIQFTGSHAIAAATESLLRRDMTLSSILATAMASLVFGILFRSWRPLVGVLPPLAIGTLITACVAVLFPRGLSAIAVGFASVVLGVGMDSGVHVYAAVQGATAEGHKNPAEEARKRITRPVLGAAIIAASAFGCLALSRIEALRQLGILSACGEVITALTILAVTPSIAARLERHRSKHPSPQSVYRLILRKAIQLLHHRYAIAISLILCTVSIPLTFFIHPVVGNALIAIRPANLAPAAVYEAIHKRFHTSPTTPWVVLFHDSNTERAQERADKIFEIISAHSDVIESVDGLGAWAPSNGTQERRREKRDALDLPAYASELEQVLRKWGMNPASFEPALNDLRAPQARVSNAEFEALRTLISSRYTSQDSEALVTVYVHPKEGQEENLDKLIHKVDPSAILTGYPRLEPALRATLVRELPRVGFAAAFLLTASLVFTLRRARDALLALFVIASEIALVLIFMRLLSIPLHIYDALVLPVLLGITIDEVLFVLFAIRGAQDQGPTAVEHALLHEAPVVITTACTTAAGFAALLICRFEALQHLGLVGSLGSLVGLFLALVMVPGALSLQKQRMHRFGGIDALRSSRERISGLGGAQETWWRSRAREASVVSMESRHEGKLAHIRTCFQEIYYYRIPVL